MKYVIIGNGFAGIRAIESIRDNDKEGEIILISGEENYSRPLISYYLGKKVRASALPYRNDEFFKKNNVIRKIGELATKLDPNSKKITLSTSEVISFDKLLIATGGSPINPPIKNNDAQGVFHFTTLADAKNIEAYIEAHEVKNAVVLGGGLIGLKATEALMDLGIQVSVIELADRILAATFDKRASGIIEKALGIQDCDVITEDTIDSILVDDGYVSGVQLRSKRHIDAKIVIIAIGVHPALDLVKSTSIQTNRGIVVNQYLETNLPDIYAAGDVAECEGWNIAILPLAARQGKIAGYNMSLTNGGNKKTYSGSFPMNSVSLAGIPTISVGLTDPKENIESYEILEKFLPKKNYYKKIILEDNIIVGAIFINDIDRAGIFTGMIKDKFDVSSFKDELMKDSFGLISLPRNYRKHLQEGDGIEV